jgi:hypothetical protein
MHTIPPGSGKLNVVVLADGPTRVIQIQDADRRESTADLAPLLSPTKRARKPIAATASSWDMFLKLTMEKGVGISVIDTEELAYVLPALPKYVLISKPENRWVPPAILHP